MINKEDIEKYNQTHIYKHKKDVSYLFDLISLKGFDPEEILQKIINFQVAIPSWALGTGGTRFGRFPEGGEPRTLEEKIGDVALINKLTASSNSISLHIPWDIPSNYDEIRSLTKLYKIKFDAVNSNTFQDQEGESQAHSYKYGSLSHVDPSVRAQAIAHNKEVIDHGIKLGSKALTVWLADGASFPGQNNFREALERTISSLKEIYEHLPEDWKMLIEYKPYEPHFYSTVIQDWGTSFLIANKLGEKAQCLVDLGHHLPNTNIEQIVATLMAESKLGGFHFNDSKYGDDDLTTGSIKPYQLFLIFNELVEGLAKTNNPEPAWMIDASHNLKDPIEDLIQSVEAINIAYAQALLVDQKKLKDRQVKNDVTVAQQILQDAFRTDMRPLIREARIRRYAAIFPLAAFRHFKIRNELISQRGKNSFSTGL